MFLAAKARSSKSWTRPCASPWSMSRACTAPSTVGLLDAVDPGDWVLIHVGFAISQVDEHEALATRRLLEQMGAEHEQELQELKASVIE